MNKVRVAVVGTGGYGHSYVRQLLDGQIPQAEFVAGIDPDPTRCPRYDDMKSAGIAMYDSLEEFFEHDSADLIAIASPIHLHCDHTCLSLEHGANVLCEKPLSGSVDEAVKMLEAEQASGQFVAIGYQWSYSPGIQQLKSDIASGAFGRPLSFKCLACWPRPLSYYKRNGWAGRIRTDDGRPVLDSPAGNATAHYLHNMLYVLGPTLSTSTFPTHVTAELYRANDIENYDFGAFRLMTENEVEVQFLTAHCIKYQIGPICHGSFELADVYYAPYGGHGTWIARFKDGTIKNYGNASSDKLQDCVNAILNGGEIACGIRAAAAQVVTISAAHESTPQITAFPEASKSITPFRDSEIVTVKSLEEIMLQCYDLGLLPSELGGIPWATPAKEVEVSEQSRLFA